MNGIPAAIIERANKLANLSIQGEDLVKICAAMNEDEEEDLEDAEAVARSFWGGILVIVKRMVVVGEGKEMGR